MKKWIASVALAACLGCGGAPEKKPDPTPAGTPNAAPTTPDAAKSHGQNGPPANPM